jgi:hypothetical protein
MADIDPDKALAALEQLEAEKERRLQARVEAGEVVVQTVTVVVGARDENVEDACERALANLPTSTPDGRPIHHDLQVIVTGVPRDPDFARWETPQVQAASSKGIADPPNEVEPAGGVLLSSRSQPAYIFTTTRQATNDGDPGQIAEALWSVDEDGCVVITTLEGRHITGRALLKDEDPAAVARSLLRESEGPKDFNRPISYPKLGLA